jgi:hypothetical protein
MRSGTVTCSHSPAMPPELLFYLSWVLISSGAFSPSSGTETELAESAIAANEQRTAPWESSLRLQGGPGGAAGLPFPAGVAFPPDGLAVPLHAASMAATAIATLVFAASQGGIDVHDMSSLRIREDV